MTPAELRARADREERVYSATELAKMLRAGAAAMEELARLKAKPEDDFEWRGSYEDQADPH